MRRKAVCGIFDYHKGLGTLKVLKLESEVTGKTKDLAKQLPKDVKGILIVAGAEEFANLSRAASNLRQVSVAKSTLLSVIDMVAAKEVWMTESALGELNI